MKTAINRPTVLIVDDVAENIQVLMGSLRGDFALLPARNGQRAIELATEKQPDIILLDIMMPEMDGYEVCRRLKAQDKTRLIPIIFVTAMSDDADEAKGLELGAVDYVTKPFNPDLVKARVRNHIELKKHRDHLEVLVMERTKELRLTQEVTIESLAALAEYRDPETGGHIRRTQNYMHLLAMRLQKESAFSSILTDSVIDMLKLSAPLHDIGKVGVLDSILLKPGKLTDDEFAIMKEHTTFGRNAIAAAEKKLGSESFLKYARQIAFEHHEKWNGKGYPQGLAGTDIHVSARIMAIADVYDALISKRVYKPPFPHTKAVSIIKADRGAHFDPDMVDGFLELQEDFRTVALEFADFEVERETLKL